MSEDQETVALAKKIGVKIDHHIIESPYGHDAFLMEPKKVRAILRKIIN